MCWLRGCRETKQHLTNMTKDTPPFPKRKPSPQPGLSNRGIYMGLGEGWGAGTRGPWGCKGWKREEHGSVISF